MCIRGKEQREREGNKKKGGWKGCKEDVSRRSRESACTETKKGEGEGGKSCHRHVTRSFLIGWTDICRASPAKQNQPNPMCHKKSITVRGPGDQGRCRSTTLTMTNIRNTDVTGHVMMASLFPLQSLSTRRECRSLSPVLVKERWPISSMLQLNLAIKLNCRA